MPASLPRRPAVRAARLSTAPLPALPGVLPPPPGAEVVLGSGTVFLRRTPWAGPAGESPGGRALLVHGLGGASTNWTDLAALLSVRCGSWAVDLPGFGRSQPPPRRGYTIGRDARVVVEVLEHVRDLPGPGAGEPVHLVGNSLGGLVALLVAARRPDLVATLSLVSPAMPVLRTPQASTRLLPLLLLPGVAGLAERRLAGIGAEDSVRGLIEVCYGDPRRVTPEQLAQAVEEMRERGDQPWADRALARSMRGLIASYLRIGPRTAWRAARTLRMPVLVVWGDRDRLVDVRLAPRLAAAVPGARLLVLQGIGHVAMLEAPEPTARAVLGLLEDAAGDAPPAEEVDEALTG